MILAILPPIGVVLSLWGGSEARRERVSISFVGYSIPWGSLRPCSLPPDPLAKTGVWIGGGDIREGGIIPDTVGLPGYRSHLVEFCKVGSPKVLSLQARVAAEGMEFNSSSGKLSLKSSDGIHTQRVVLRSLAGRKKPDDLADRCLALPNGSTVSEENLIKSVQAAWVADRRKGPATFRRKIKDVFRRLPLDTGREVFCMDLAGMHPCQRALPNDPRSAIDPRKATFVWLQESDPFHGATWSVLPGAGAEWSQCPAGPRKTPSPVQIAPSAFKATDRLDDSAKGKLPGFSLQMVSRRTLGGAADQAVPVPVDSMSPSGFRLGPPRDFRLAVLGNRLLILFDEPATQIRYDDLFGAGESRAPSGEFTLSFGAPEGGDLLAANLSAVVDGYTPKPLIEKWRAAVRLSSISSQAYTITAPGASPESHRFDEIIPVPTPFSAKPERTTAPLILIRRMGTPTGVLLVPTLASLVLLVGILLLMNTSAASGVPWDLSMLGVLLLDFRFLLTTRLWMDAPSSSSDTNRWLISGCYPILFAPFVFLASSILWHRIAKQSLHTSLSGPSPRGRFLRSDSAKILLWLGMAVLGSLVWLLVGTALTFFDRLRNSMTTALDFIEQSAILLIAVLIAWVGFELARALSVWGSKGAGALVLSPSRGRTRRMTGAFPLLFVCVTLGLLLALSRLLLLFLGWQESLPFGIKLDVFYLPLVTGVLAGICSGSVSKREGLRLSGTAIVVLAAFAITGWLLSDLGLLWVGGMAFLLVLPFEFRRLRPSSAAVMSLTIFLVLFMTPKLFPQPFLFFLQRESSSTLEKAKVLYPDPLQVRRDRDHYRMMDAVAPEVVRLIPAQLAREVTIERFRIRYQALKGAWREGLRSDESYGASWSGAGLLQARPVVGERAFREAARSDYVYQIYLRAEHGTAGLISLLFIYLTFLLVPLLEHQPSSSGASSLAIWALAVAVGSALFMLGGTHGIFPFSGKWTFFMALGSRSDFCLSTALIILAGGGQYDAK